MLFTSDYTVKMPMGETLLTAIIGILTVLMILAIIDVLIMFVSKIVRAIESRLQSKNTAASVEAAPTKSEGTPLPGNVSQGQLDLVGVDEPTAAVIMALVSHQSGIPLNRLCFKSIRLTEDENK